MRWVFALLLLVGSLILAGQPNAAEMEEAVPGLCVSELGFGADFGPGIRRPSLESDVWLTLCGGAPAVLVFADGRLTKRDPAPDILLLKSTVMPLSREDTERKAANSEEALRSVPCVADMLPDMQVTHFEDSAVVLLIGGTQIYAHGILGDTYEPSGLCVIDLQSRQAVTLTLAPDSVFEDLRVRLVDLTGDGQEEFVVIRSYLERGAALAVYHLVEGRIEHLAETPAIGIPNRWLNPAGAADFDGDGRVEIAYVETPHIGGTLRLWELRDGALQQEQAVEGFSNHAIGSRQLDLSAVLDWNADGVPDLALPDAARRTLRVVSFAGGKVAELDRFSQDAEITTAILATDLDADGKPELLYGLADGRLLLARP